MKKLVVLLASYNGEKYIAEQLDSIFNQICSAKIQVVVRDDGSTDHTIQIVEEYQKRYQDQLILYKEKNVGIYKNFMRLIQLAPEAEYYAFSDQDDVWVSNKASVAIEKIDEKQKVPCLFYSGYDVVDQNLNKMNSVYEEDDKACHSVTQILFQNRVPGCTMVFNRELMCTLKKIKLDTVQMHDAYVCAVAYCFGVVISCSESLILYRQHSNNTLGFNKKKKHFGKWLTEKKKLFKEREPYHMDQIAQAILQESEGKISQESRAELQRIATYRCNMRSRLQLFFSRETSREDINTAISVKCKILFCLF